MPMFQDFPQRLRRDRREKRAHCPQVPTSVKTYPRHIVGAARAAEKTGPKWQSPGESVSFRWRVNMRKTVAHRPTAHLPLGHL